MRNLPGFVRFLPIAALFHSQVVNVSEIARDAGVARTTVQGYLDILVDTLLAYRLPAYEARLRVRERKLPKLYWVDPGILRGVKRQLGAVGLEERGPLKEDIVLTTLRAHAEMADLYEEIFYWQPHQSRDIEVDFLLRRGNELLAIEVKATDRYHSGLLKGLRAVENLDKLVRRVPVYTGHRPFRSSDGIEIWPFAHFFGGLRIFNSGRSGATTPRMKRQERFSPSLFHSRGSYPFAVWAYSPGRAFPRARRVSRSQAMRNFKAASCSSATVGDCVGRAACFA